LGHRRNIYHEAVHLLRPVGIVSSSVFELVKRPTWMVQFLHFLFQWRPRGSGISKEFSTATQSPQVVFCGCCCRAVEPGRRLSKWVGGPCSGRMNNSE
jgi:hypothetical protein